MLREYLNEICNTQISEEKKLLQVYFYKYQGLHIYVAYAYIANREKIRYEFNDQFTMHLYR